MSRRASLKILKNEGYCQTILEEGQAFCYILQSWRNLRDIALDLIQQGTQLKTVKCSVPLWTAIAFLCPYDAGEMAQWLEHWSMQVCGMELQAPEPSVKNHSSVTAASHPSLIIRNPWVPGATRGQHQHVKCGVISHVPSLLLSASSPVICLMLNRCPFPHPGLVCS